jgi:hypothetical protein
VAKLVPGNPPVVTNTPKFVVDAGSLPPGSYKFTLVVEDASGVKSPPSTITIRVTAT